MAAPNQIELARAIVGGARQADDGITWVTLFTGRDDVNQVLGRFCVNAKQRALFVRRPVDIEAVQGRVDPSKVAVRPSYLNALLIQSRGRVGMTCEACAAKPNRGPFADCRRVAGHFDGCCANCKWRDHAARCSVRAVGEPEEPELQAAEPEAQVVEVEDD